MPFVMPRSATFVALAVAFAACAHGQPTTSATPASGFVPVDQGQIYYETTGSGPAVVLVHGGYGDRRMWDDQFRDLARNFRVVRYDHRGFGRSTRPVGPYSPVRDLTLLLDHLHIERAHLVGNSLGGAFVLDFALVHPERVDRLVVVSSGASGYPYKREEVQSIIAVFEAARQQGVNAAVEQWLRHPMVAVSSQAAVTRKQLRAMATANSGIFLINAWPEEKLKPTAYERLQEIHRPTLFIIGERDTELVRNSAQQSAARVPNAQVKIIAGTDHLPQMLRPGEFNRIVGDFLLGH